MTSKESWVTAEVECEHCKREWAAVYPVGTLELECPMCKKKMAIVVIDIPDTIYLQIESDGELMDEWTWRVDRVHDTDVEYVRRK